MTLGGYFRRLEQIGTRRDTQGNTQRDNPKVTLKDSTQPLGNPQGQPKVDFR
ncbi:hypothetical protein [Escherichia phage pO111]|uniref:Uncharacterized protein n=1 Tax=Escherichia phage pO111 TaxID=3072193 RepID=A0AA51R612_9CAUD|nr:hypothetical protein [Escherichia phage pO111]